MKSESRTKFYKSTAWYRIRAAALSRDRHLCQRCLLLRAEGKRKTVSEATEVHHIDELHNGDDYLEKSNNSNLICLCHKCHNHITNISHGGKFAERTAFDESGNLVSLKDPEEAIPEDALFWGKGKTAEEIKKAIEGAKKP